MKELLTALCKAKRQFASIKKDKVNPHFNSKYASLDSVLAAVEPGLLAHELMLTSLVIDGNLVTRLYHSSGEYLESSFALPNLSDPQKLGSTISYFRRYAICGLLSVTADEDDDGNAAKPPAKQAAYTPLPQSPISKPSQKITETQAALTECMEILGWSKEQKVAWVRTISPKPCDLWDLITWELAIVKAHMEIDKMNSIDNRVDAGWHEQPDRPGH